jgi:predicted dithiol-disulfide oxidoreductase (DUF899 family)
VAPPPSSNGNLFHTYPAYARRTEMTMNTYNYLDYVPKGRDVHFPVVLKSSHASVIGVFF